MRAKERLGKNWGIGRRQRGRTSGEGENKWKGGEQVERG